MAIFKMIDVTKNFGGLKAVSKVNLEVKSDEILGLIGPNGAGKTTVFNLITGFFYPNNGDIVFENQSIVGLKPHEVCELGITRSFQIVKPFSGLTVLENVMIGAFRLTKNPNVARQEALAVLDFLQLTHLSKMKAGSLTLSDRKRIEIARALATRPKLLLLDEPMGGMNAAEVESMVAEIQKIRQGGITLIVIEHVMRAVMAISDRIIVLNHGEKIAEGTPNEVSKNREVVTAYLGEEYHVS